MLVTDVAAYIWMFYHHVYCFLVRSIAHAYLWVVFININSKELQTWIGGMC